MTLWTRPCACGGEVTADPLDPTPGVREHIETPEHRVWSDRCSVAPRYPDGPSRPLAGPLTVDRLRELGLVPEVAA